MKYYFLSSEHFFIHCFLTNHIRISTMFYIWRPKSKLVLLEVRLPSSTAPILQKQQTINHKCQLKKRKIWTQELLIVVTNMIYFWHIGQFRLIYKDYFACLISWKAVQIYLRISLQFASSLIIVLLNYVFNVMIELHHWLIIPGLHASFFCYNRQRAFHLTVIIRSMWETHCYCKPTN